MQDIVDHNINSPSEFEEIYNLHWEKVYTICYFHLKDSDLAKDLVQDIFLSLLERKKEIHFSISVEAYLIGAAKLKVIEHIRNQTNRQKKLEALTPIYPNQSNSTEDNIFSKELSEKINKAIEFLPDQCRKILILSRFEGKKNREISEKLEISERVVEYNISKALQVFRKNLKEYIPFL